MTNRLTYQVSIAHNEDLLRRAAAARRAAELTGDGGDRRPCKRLARHRHPAVAGLTPAIRLR